MGTLWVSWNNVMHLKLKLTHWIKPRKCSFYEKQRRQRKKSVSQTFSLNEIQCISTNMFGAILSIRLSAMCKSRKGLSGLFIMPLFPALIPYFLGWWQFSTAGWQDEKQSGSLISLSLTCALWPQFKINMILPSPCPRGCTQHFRIYLE